MSVLEQYLVEFAVGFGLGFFGQLIRVLIGIRTGVYHVRIERPQGDRILRVVVLLILGGLAGGLYAWAFPWGEFWGEFPERGEVIGLIAAGYAGPDAIEKLLEETLPGERGPGTPPTA